MAEPAWMIYGASGYTGRLVAEEAVRQGLSPVLAGRTQSAIAGMAQGLGLDYRVFDLESAATIKTQIGPMAAVLLCAGPFSHTSQPMLDACLATGTHYLDVTGEIGVFEACHRRNHEAASAKCVVMPGVGFDVVPTDCLAAALAAALPDAQDLELAFHSNGGLSKGTAKTMLEGFPRGGAVREAGRIRSVPLAWKVKQIPFRDKTRTAMTIPWGDVSTAYYSTGIPNIRVYTSASPRSVRIIKLAKPLRSVVGLAPVQRLLTRWIDAKLTPPGPSARAKESCQLWGKVTAADGRSIEGTAQTIGGYSLTALTAVESVKRVIAGDVEAGAKTPSMAFGSGFLAEFRGCDLRVPG